MKPEDEIKTIDDAIALAVSRKADLVQLIKDQEKPKYEDGTPGYIHDSKKDTGNTIVRLINTGRDTYPYSGYALNDGGRYSAFKYFTPLETCIMGMKYRHEGGEYPGNGNDHILKISSESHERSGQAYELSWGDMCFDYYIIKRG